MFTLAFFVFLLMSVMGVFLAHRTRRRRWLLVALPFLIILALYGLIMFACFGGSTCP
jgi:hypothetical protein